MSVSSGPPCRVHAWDVEWVDVHGGARVCGFLVPQSEVRDRVRTGDRTGTGRLSAAAKERIAGELTVVLRRIAAGALGYDSDPVTPLVLRDCDG